MAGLLARYRDGEFEVETLKMAVISAATMRTPTAKVAPKGDEIVFGGQHHESINLWLVMCFAIMFFVMFCALLWMFS